MIEEILQDIEEIENQPEMYVIHQLLEQPGKFRNCHTGKVGTLDEVEVKGSNSVIVEYEEI